MADISMCNNHRCPLSSTCYRYLAKPSLYQCYFIMSEENKQKIKDTGTCSEYWKCETKEDLAKYDSYWYEP